MRGFLSAGNAALAAACLATLSFALPQSSAPVLRLGTAPFVGQTLTLEIDGAAPAAAVDLYFSPEPGSFPMSYGVLELRRELLEHMASGTTSPSGTWSFDLSVPLDAALAETGAHFQALVGDPAAPAQRIFSSAVHARFLGPRVYAGYRSLGVPHRVGMYVLSGVTDTVVARAYFGLTSEVSGSLLEGKPVFDAAYTRAAVMYTRQDLALFDPYFGGVQARVAFASTCSRTVFVDAQHRTVYVLELAAGASPARVHAIELSTGSETAHLDLPNVVEPVWCLGDASSEVFIAEYDASGRTAIRWVGLDPLSDRGSVSVGTPASDSFGSTPVPMVYAGGQLFVATHQPSGFYWGGNLTRCWVAPSGLVARAKDLGLWAIQRMVAAPESDRVLGGWGATNLGPAFGPFEISISTGGNVASFPSPYGVGGDFNVWDIVPDGGEAWFVGGWEFRRLYALDIATHAWTPYPFVWQYGPSDAELLRDVWDHELWVSNRGVAPPVDIAPEILIVDELHSTSRHIALPHTAEVLHAVPLP